MKRLSRVTTLAALGAALWLGTHAAAAQAAEFHRGIGVGALAWAAVEPGAEHRFAFPPFVGPSYTLTADELQTLRRTGFDFIRLAVDPGPFLQFTGAQRDALDRILLDRVRLVLSSGFAVIVDFHPSDMQPDFIAQALTAGLRTPVFQNYLVLLERTAALLGRLHTARVALELMNEPPVAPQLWQPMLEAGYAAARRGSADLQLVLEGGNEASAPALIAMQTGAFAADPKVLYAFHYYEPYQFTHQGASWNPARYLADVPYPALARPLHDSLDATAAAIAASGLSPPQQILAELDARARLEDYRRSAFDSRAIGTAFDAIADWGRAHGISPDRILLGEFGARETELQRDGLRADERAQWFHDVSAQAVSHGFGWAVWAYRGEGGFALAKGEGSDEIEPDIARALGLRPGLRADAAGAAAGQQR